MRRRGRQLEHEIAHGGRPGQFTRESLIRELGGRQSMQGSHQLVRFRAVHRGAQVTEDECNHFESREREIAMQPAYWQGAQNVGRKQSLKSI